MAKYVITLGFILVITGALKAQTVVSTAYRNNPFMGMVFGTTYKDTVTVNATYLGEAGKASSDNLVTLSQIGKLHGLNISKLQRSIAFHIAGFPQRFYMPYRAENAPAIAAAKPNTFLKLKCIVYRFFTIDGTTNFFYIDKVVR
ncbi:hypothetical protein A0256_12430 [Mucilaginibacter sp. PAMC 26640]|nr:hypothetical protein A0256_12430 [Mucilaginibacter sp. PAMC 26640]